VRGGNEKIVSSPQRDFSGWKREKFVVHAEWIVINWEAVELEDEGTNVYYMCPEPSEPKLT